jgi:hypothetical protein
MKVHAFFFLNETQLPDKMRFIKMDRQTKRRRKTENTYDSTAEQKIDLK